MSLNGIVRIKSSAWHLVNHGLTYRHTNRKYGPKGGKPVYLYFVGHPRIGGKPPRWVRKIHKLMLRGTYHRADQWALDLSRKRVIRSAEALAKHLNCTGAELLAEVGFQ